MKVKNVVVVNDFNYIQGGASKVAIDTARMLNKEGKKNVYFFSAVNKEEEKIDGIKYVTTNQNEALKENNRILGFINGIYNVKARRKFKELLNGLDNKNTVIHIHGWTKALSSSVFDVAFKSKFKVILTTHDYFSACPNGGFFDYNKNKICHLKPLSFKCLKCDCDSRNYFFKLYRLIRIFVQNNIVKIRKKIKYVIGISNLNIEILQSYFNKNVKYKKIINPINIKIEEEAISIDYRKNDYYLFVGRLSKEKGVNIFCEVIESMGLKGIVVGDGEERQKLENNFKNIEFVGWKNTEDVYEYMKKAKALIFPSLWYEGAPLTPLEAKCNNIPCVVSNCTSAVEYECTKSLIFDPKDLKSLKECITKVEEGKIEYNLLKDNNLKEILSHNYIKEVLNFYEEE